MSKQLTRKEKAILAIGKIPYTINNLSAYTINNLSADTINNLSAYTIKNLSADTINNLSADTINNLSAYTINNLSADTIKNLSADTINNLSADTINNLSAYTIKKINSLKEFIDECPKIDNIYTRMLSEINEGKRKHMQSTFGDIETWEQACKAENNLCKTPMCTAGMAVNMAGEWGYKALKRFGWATTAEIVFTKSHPDYPVQNFGGIQQDLALAFIEEMAECEANGTTFSL